MNTKAWVSMQYILNKEIKTGPIYQRCSRLKLINYKFQNFTFRLFTSDLLITLYNLIQKQNHMAISFISGNGD